MDDIVVHLDRVSRRFGNVEAVRGLSLALEPGKCFGLLGRNGAGKSTALRLVMGMLRPDAGTVRLFGLDPLREPERAKLRVGYLAEDQTFPEVLQPRDLFAFFADCHPTWDWDFAESLVRRFHIPVDRRLSALSKGEKRQTALICAVAHRPRLLVMDEPGGGLDPVVRRGFLEEVIELLSREQTTVLFSSHHLQEVERLADRVGFIDHGRLVLEQDLDALIEGSCRVVAEIDEASLLDTLESCVRAERRGPTWQLTVRCPPEAAEHLVTTRLRGRVLETAPVTLEDLYVAMLE